MDNITTEKDIFRQIEHVYGFSIKSFTKAPRGWWAETFIIDTDKDKYFVKLFIKEMDFKQLLNTSLVIQSLIADKIDFVPKPIKTKENLFLHTLKNKRVVALYSYINGTNYRPKDSIELLDLMVNIYKLEIECNNKYHFNFHGKNVMMNLQNNIHITKYEILKSYLKENIELLGKYWNIYKNLFDKMDKTGTNNVITHGDLDTNLLIDNNKKVFIVDWDCIYLGPIERDMYPYVDTNTDINELEKIAKISGLKWKFNKNCHNYFILNHFFDDFGILINLDKNSIHDDEKLIAERIDGIQNQLKSLGKKLFI